MGDNPLAARITGVPTRHMMVLQYVLSSLVAFIAGVVTATLVNSMNTRVATSTMVYDVILVVVIGGVGLSGGKGSVRNVLVGTLLVGTLLNGMTIMDIPYTFQNIVKSLILLVAIVTDSLLNPRDEQTSQQGDI
jgi:ribose transport system permease protein